MDGRSPVRVHKLSTQSEHDRCSLNSDRNFTNFLTPINHRSRGRMGAFFLSFFFFPSFFHKAAEIIEGCVQYNNGPKCFGKDAPFGDYGFTANYPDEIQPGGCPPLPTNFDKSKVRVNKMSEAIGSPYSGCFVECNLIEVSATGVDPCSPGDFSSPTSGHNTMKCYSGGVKFVKPFPSGICAFNCTLVYPDSRKPCSNNSVFSTCVLTCTDSAL